MKTIRVFPTKTKATPDDKDVRINVTPSFFDEADEVHISVAFTWDLPRAEWLYNQWLKAGFNVKIGGVATGERGGDFINGMYLKKGYTITSRGCNNHCWFCSVPKREGKLRELPIVDGFNILDDNFLACCEQHKNAVYEMLKRQPEQPRFTGGLEAKILTHTDAEKLFDIKPKSLYFAYDTKDDYEPLIEAGKLLTNIGFSKAGNVLKCYVLIGYPADTFDAAEKRLINTIKAGFMPMAMFYRDNNGKRSKDWGKFQRVWANKKIVGAKMKQYGIY